MTVIIASKTHNKCLMDNVKKARTYVVRITGTDKSGNSASALCDLTVGAGTPTGPLFLLSSIEAEVEGVVPWKG